MRYLITSYVEHHLEVWQLDKGQDFLLTLQLGHAIVIPTRMPAVTANNCVINKTARGMNHAPPGDPVTVPPGGTVTACNFRKKNVRLKVTVDGVITYSKVLKPDECVTLTVGSAELPEANYKVIDPPSVLKIVGVRGATFRFKS